MDPIQILMDEHRLIERVTLALDGYSTRLESGGDLDPADLADFVTFIRQFADARHHGKEEQILFEAMIAHGFSPEAGPVGVMLSEHEEGRRLTGILADGAGRASAWTDADRQRLAQAARGYTELLRAHIFKEDHVLYPMAVQHLSGEAMGDVSERCARFDEERDRGRTDDAIRAKAESLIARYATAG